MADAIYVDIVSPSGSVFKGDVRGVVAPGTEGSFEVLKNHAPMIASFEVGAIVLTQASGEKIRFAIWDDVIEGGVLPDVFSVMVSPYVGMRSPITKERFSAFGAGVVD